jgi:hypothetical protein
MLKAETAEEYETRFLTYKKDTMDAVRIFVADTTRKLKDVELPHLEGSNPKLWQRRCEEYFQRWGTPTIH